VMDGEMVSGLDAARLRVVLRDAMSGAKEIERPDDGAATDPEPHDAASSEAETEWAADADSAAVKPAAIARSDPGRQARSAG